MAHLYKPVPWCCYVCGLRSHKFPDDFIRQVESSGITVLEYVPRQIQQLRRHFSQTDVKVMKAMAEEMQDLCRGLPPPMTHPYYYQDKIVSTGHADLDEKLGGGLQRGRVYCFYEARRNRFGGENLLRNILENAQRKVDKPGTVPGLANAMEYALVLTTTHENPQYLTKPIDHVIHKHCEILENGRIVEAGLLSVLANLQRSQNPGVIVVEVPRGIEDDLYANADPLMEYWVLKLEEKYEKVEDKVLIFLVDISLLTEEPIHKRRRWFLRLSARTNISMIDMVHKDSDRWEVEKFVPREPFEL